VRTGPLPGANQNLPRCTAQLDTASCSPSRSGLTRPIPIITCGITTALWNNNGTWFIHYVIHPTPFTKERIRRSLGTKSLAEARVRRDAILSAAEQPEPLALAA
jgi:hypothetical protein